MGLDTQELAQACADAMWEGDQASKAMGMEILEMAPGFTRITMSVRKDMVNGYDICHGGYLFSLADSAFAFACNTHNLSAVAAGARIEFLRPAYLDDKLTAEATQVAQGRRSGVYDAVVTNQNDKIVALFRGNSARIDGMLVDGKTGKPL